MRRDILIGDIHGCWAELQRLLAELAVTAEDRVISVGDLVDRGPDSARCWEFFRDRPGSLVLMGNHERKHVRGVLSYSQEIVKVQLADRYDAFRAWAAELPYFLETPDYVAVHGGFEDGVPLAEQREDVLAATTSGTKHLEKLHGDTYWPQLYSGTKPIVFGHHVVGDEARVWGGRAYALDTGACHGGYLSALVVPGFQIHRVKAARDHWRDEQQRWQVPVLRARAWPQMRWKKLQRELEPLRRNRHADVQAFAEALQHWLAEVDALVPAVIERVCARAEALGTEHDDRAVRKAVAAQPFSALLFASLAGSLDTALLKSQLGSPAAILEAATAYSVAGPGPFIAP